MTIIRHSSQSPKGRHARKSAWETLVNAAIEAQIAAGNIYRLPDGSIALTLKGHLTAEAIKNKRKSPLQ